MEFGPKSLDAKHRVQRNRQNPVLKAEVSLRDPDRIRRLEFLYIIVPVVLPGLFGLWFDLADGVLQAIIFSYLTMSYIGEIVEVGHELQEKESGKVEEEKKVIDESAVAA